MSTEAGSQCEELLKTNLSNALEHFAKNRSSENEMVSSAKTLLVALFDLRCQSENVFKESAETTGANEYRAEIKQGLMKKVFQLEDSLDIICTQLTVHLFRNAQIYRSTLEFIVDDFPERSDDDSDEDEEDLEKEDGKFRGYWKCLASCAEELEVCIERWFGCPVAEDHPPPPPVIQERVPKHHSWWTKRSDIPKYVWPWKLLNAAPHRHELFRKQLIGNYLLLPSFPRTTSFMRKMLKIYMNDDLAKSLEAWSSLFKSKKELFMKVVFVCIDNPSSTHLEIPMLRILLGQTCQFFDPRGFHYYNWSEVIKKYRFRSIVYPTEGVYSSESEEDLWTFHNAPAHKWEKEQLDETLWTQEHADIFMLQYHKWKRNETQLLHRDGTTELEISESDARSSSAHIASAKESQFMGKFKMSKEAFLASELQRYKYLDTLKRDREKDNEGNVLIIAIDKQSKEKVVIKQIKMKEEQATEAASVKTEEVGEIREQLALISGGSRSTQTSAPLKTFGEFLGIGEIGKKLRLRIHVAAVKADLLRVAKHPNILRLQNIFTPDTTADVLKELFVVTNYAGDTLFCLRNEMKKNGQRMKNIALSHIVHQILVAVDFLFECGLHCQNLSSSSIVINSYHITIVDMGTSQLTDRKNPKNYWAPELLYTLKEADNESSTLRINKVDRYNKVDTWAIGCIMGELIRQELLFGGKDCDSIYISIADVIVRPTYYDFYDKFIKEDKDKMLPYRYPSTKVTFEEYFPDSCFEDRRGSGNFTCENARDLLFKMLTCDSKNRPTVKKCLEHPYFEKWIPQNGYVTEEIKQAVACLEVNQMDSGEIKDRVMNIIAEFRGKTSDASSSAAKLAPGLTKLQP